MADGPVAEGNWRDIDGRGNRASKEKKEKKAKADAFKRELDALATQVTKSWQGPQDAVAAIREQRRG